MLLRDYEQTNFITGLRAFAVLGVFLIHSGGGGLRDISEFWNTLVNWGQYGVDVFFVISGYTIFYQFFKSDYKFRYFIIQRVIRLSVPYWPLLLLLFIMGVIGIPLGTNYWGHGAQGLDISWVNWLLHLTYLNFCSAEYSNNIIGVEWTLGIEFFYYVTLGLIINLYLVHKVSLFRMFVIGCFFLVVACLGFYAIQTHKVENYLNIYWNPILYGYMFVLGGIAYFCRERLNNSLNVKVRSATSDGTCVLALFALWIAFTLDCSAYNHWVVIFASHLFVALVTFLLVVFLQDASIFGRVITCKPLLFIGSISYSMYLIHFLILNTVFLRVNGLSTASSFIYLLCVTIIASYVWYYVFEKRIYGAMKMKIRKFQ